MSGLLAAVKAAIDPWLDTKAEDPARAAVEAVAAWLEGRKDCDLAYEVIRMEVAPPKPTAEDVIREWLTESVSTVPAPGQGANAARLAAALRDAGMLREDAL